MRRSLTLISWENLCRKDCVDYYSFLTFIDELELQRQKRVLYGNGMFENKKEKISSQEKILTKVRHNVGNRNDSN